MAVLVAGTAEAVHTARLIMGEGFDYRPAFSLEQARAFLRPAPRLIVCSMRFDDARMIDFLQGLREDEQCSGLPVVCFHAHGREVSPSAHQAMQETLESFGNARFVDLFGIARSRGVPAATAALRQAVASASGG